MVPALALGLAWPTILSWAGCLSYGVIPSWSGKYLGPAAMATKVDQYSGSQVYGNSKGAIDSSQ